MSYTKLERKQIAAQIREYLKESEYETCRVYDHIHDKFTITRHPMTAYDREWLDLVARDVQGLVNHFA